MVDVDVHSSTHSATTLSLPASFDVSTSDTVSTIANDIVCLQVSEVCQGSPHSLKYVKDILIGSRETSSCGYIGDTRISEQCNCDTATAATVLDDGLGEVLNPKEIKASFPMQLGIVDGTTGKTKQKI